MASLSALAFEPNGERSKKAKIALKKIVHENFNTMTAVRKMGFFCFKFFRMGKWHEVVIDELLPNGTEFKEMNKQIIQDPGKCYLARCKASKTNEYWAPLCEKAYAKFTGSYFSIVGGTPGKIL